MIFTDKTNKHDNIYKFKQKTKNTPYKNTTVDKYIYINFVMFRHPLELIEEGEKNKLNITV